VLLINSVTLIGQRLIIKLDRDYASTKFLTHFVFTLGRYLFLLFLVQFRDERSGWLIFIYA